MCHEMSGFVRFRHVRPAAGRNLLPVASTGRNPPARHFDRSGVSRVVEKSGRRRRRPQARSCGVGTAPIGFLHSAPAGDRASGRNDGMEGA